MSTNRSIIRYSQSFKQQIVREIEEEGLGIEFVRRRYGIKGGETIQNWLRKFGRTDLLNQIVRIEMKDEKDRLKELEAENKRLKIALADATMKNDMLEHVIEMANRDYKTDLKKTIGPRVYTRQAKKDIP
jgi:transposase-like protein